MTPHDRRPIGDTREHPVAATAPTVARGSGRVRPPIVSDQTPAAPRYQRLGELGVGGFGVVEQRFDRALRRQVACKFPVHTDSAHDAALLREARLLAYLDHPGVVQVYDLQEDDREVSYTMELLEGESLAERLDRVRESNQRVPVSEALRIITRVCETTANAHAKGVIHLDLKPANVMLQPFGHVSVIDWGIARVYDPAPYRAHLERAGEPDLDDLLVDTVSGGTPTHMPPEQFFGTSELRPAADIYAIGTLLFELLAGRLPFEERDGLPALLLAKTNGAPRLRALRPEVSGRLDDICYRMLAPLADDRPSRLEDVLRELAALSDIGGESELVHLAPGERLFSQGEESTTAYEVVSGELEILVEGEEGARVVATRGPGAIIGELALLSGARRSASVRAGVATVVRAIDWAAIEDELSRVDPFIGRMVRALSDKLIETTRD